MTFNSGKKVVGGEGGGVDRHSTQERKLGREGRGGGSIDGQLENSLCIFAGITFDFAGGGGGSVNLERICEDIAKITLTMLILGWGGGDPQ